MSVTHLSLAGALYKWAEANLIPTGGRQYSVDSIPWQEGDPAQKLSAIWNIDGPQLFSNETISEQAPVGPLLTDYTDGCDTRWENVLTLAPAQTSAKISTLDVGGGPELMLDVASLLDLNSFLDTSPLAANCSDIEQVQAYTSSGILYAYFARGNFVTKIRLTDLAIIDNAVFTDFVTDLQGSQTASGVREISAALKIAAYQAAQVTDGSDTWGANSGSQQITNFGQPPDRIVGLTGNIEVLGNILTGAVTMAAPNWLQVTTQNSGNAVVGQQITPTGFVNDGYIWYIMTNRGPYVLDPKQGSVYPMIPEIDMNSENGRQPFYSSFVGAIYGLRTGSRWQKGGNGASFGVETYAANRSPVQGYPTAGAASTRWIYQAIFNKNTNTTWLLAWHPDEREVRQNRIASPFVIGKLAGNAVSRSMAWIGNANESRSTQILLMGFNAEANYIVVGETPQEIDDPNYLYASSGTWWGTEMYRYPHLLKQIEAVEFEAVGCSAGQTITAGVQLTIGDTVTTITLNGSLPDVNNIVTSSGYTQRLFVDNSSVWNPSAAGYRVKPFITMTTDDSTKSPKVLGALRVYFTLRPLLINKYTWIVELKGNNQKTAYDQLGDLQALQTVGPVAIEDSFSDKFYVRVDDVVVMSEALPPTNPDRAKDGLTLLVKIVSKQWITAPNILAVGP